MPDRFIRAGATGAGTGLNWTDAYASFAAAGLHHSSSTAPRGNTYYIADGTYSEGHIHIQNAASGTTAIIFKKATASDHGTELGWSASYGDGSATLTGEFTTSVPYVEMYGQSGTLDGTFGLRVVISAGDVNCLTILAGAHHLTFDHIELKNRGYSYGGSAYMNGFQDVYSGHDNTFTYCWMHCCNQVGVGLSGTYNYTFDHCWFSEIMNMDDTVPPVHGEAFSINSTANSGQSYIRFCTFRNIEGTCWIGLMNNGARTNFNWDIYGNVFYVDADHILDGWASGTQPSEGHFDASDAIIDALTPCTCTNINIYNNTFCNIQWDHAVWLAKSNVTATNCYVRNNLYIHATRNPSASTAWHGVTTGELSNNVVTTDTTYVVDYANHDYRLAKPTAAGYTLSSPYNIDFAGETRGADGTWDVGAYEYRGMIVLSQNGAQRYYRMRYRDADSNVSGWSSGADYFAMAITVSGGVALGAMTVSGSAVQPKTASGGVTLGKIEALGAAGMPQKYASGNVGLGTIAVAGDAARVLTASGNVPLGVMTAAGDATRILVASGSVPLGAVTLLGEVLRNGAASLRMPGATYYWKMRFRDADGTISSWSNGADYFITGVIRGDIILGAISVAGDVAITRYASGNIPLGAATIAGDAMRIITNSGGVTLGVVAISGDAARVIIPAGSVELAPIRVSGGLAKRGVVASGGTSLGAITVAGATNPVRLADGNINLGAVTVSGKMANVASGTITLGAVTVAGYSPGMSAIIDALTRIDRRITVTARIEKRHTIDAYLEGDHTQ